MVVRSQERKRIRMNIIDLVTSRLLLIFPEMLHIGKMHNPLNTDSANSLYLLAGYGYERPLRCREGKRAEKEGRDGKG